MASYSRWDDFKRKRRTPDTETRATVEQDLALGQLIYDLHTEAGLSQRELAARMGTTQSVISRMEEGGGARNRIDTLARVATALNRHLVVSFPEKLPAKLKERRSGGMIASSATRPATPRSGHAGGSGGRMPNQTSNQPRDIRWTGRHQLDRPAPEVPAQRHPLDAPSLHVRGTS